MPLPHSLPAVLLTAALLATPGLAAAGTKAPSPLALSCLACHAPEVDAATMPALHHLSPEALAASLRASRDDPQPGSIMARYTQFLTDAEIDALAAELGRVSPRPAAR